MKTLKYLITGIIFLAFLHINVNTFAGDFGLRAGYHSAALYHADDGKIENSLGNFYIGAFKDNRIIPTLRWGLGIEYFQNGSKIDNDNKRVLHTVSFPLYLKAKVGPVYATGGTGFNFLLSDDIIDDGEKYDPGEGEEFKKFDMPAHLGLGFSIMILSIEARYHWGLLEVDDKIKNRYLQIGATISF